MHTSHSLKTLISARLIRITGLDDSITTGDTSYLETVLIGWASQATYTINERQTSSVK